MLLGGVGRGSRPPGRLAHPGAQAQCCFLALRVGICKAAPRDPRDPRVPLCASDTALWLGAVGSLARGNDGTTVVSSCLSPAH